MGFKPKDNIASELARQQEVKFSQEKFVEDVFNGDYILVVGSEVVMNRDVEPSGDVNSYILRALNDSLNRNYSSFNDMFVSHGDGIDPIRNLLNSNEYWSYEMSDISPELRALMETRLFPFVLTTTFDGYLEQLMEHVWGKGGYRVVNIDDKRQLDALRNALMECRDGRVYREPTLFYIFGKAVQDESKMYVHTDDDAIVIIEKWMQMPKDDPVLRFIRNKMLLALGCKFSDWYFRFFWYILKREVSRFREGQVAFMLNSGDQGDSHLEAFLKRARIYRHDDARAFMADITTMFTSRDVGNVFSTLEAKTRQLGGVFISYCSKDTVIARQLFYALTRRGYNVWLDSASMKGGDDYNSSIEEAIGRAHVVVTLLTPSIAADFANGRTDNYYNREWRIAAQLPDKVLLPLATGGYNLRAPYHQQHYEQTVGATPSGIDLMQADGFNRLIESLDKSLRHHHLSISHYE